MSKLITVKDLAKHLSVPEGTIRRWVLNKEIPFKKVGPGKRGAGAIRFDENEVDRWIERRSNRSAKEGVKMETEVTDVDLPTPEEIMENWDVKGKEENYLEKMLKSYRLFIPGKENFHVDFNLKAGGERIRRSLRTNDEDEAHQNANLLIRSWFKHNAEK